MMKYPLERLDGEDLRKEYPYLKLPDGFEGLLTRTHSGHISPRHMVNAQQIIASKNGCHIKDDVVAQVRHHGDKIEVRRHFVDYYKFAILPQLTKQIFVYLYWSHM